MITGTETVTIVRRTEGAVDEYGNPSETTSLIPVTGCLISFGSTDEPVFVDSNPVRSQVSIYFPQGTTIQPDDAFVFRGSSWVKDGRQMDWVSPFLGQQVGVVVNVRQERG